MAVFLDDISDCNGSICSFECFEMSLVAVNVVRERKEKSGGRAFKDLSSRPQSTTRAKKLAECLLGTIQAVKSHGLETIVATTPCYQALSAALALRNAILFAVVCRRCPCLG